MFFNLLTDNAFIGIVAVGVTFVILSGGIDLSVGSVITFTGVLLTKLIGTYGMHPGYAIALAVLSGIVFSLYTSAGYALAASSVELDAIAAVVIGGTLLTGGVGMVLGNLLWGADSRSDSNLYHL